MENQQQDQQGQEQQGQENVTKDENYQNGGVIPDDQIDGSDADTDENLDSSVNPDQSNDESDLSGVGSQTEEDADRNVDNDPSEFDIDESTGGTAI